MSKNDKVRIGSYFVSLIVFAITLFVFRYFFSLPGLENAIVLNDKWDVIINDKVYEDVILDKLSFDATDKGDVIDIICTIPEFDYIEPILVLDVYHSAYSVYVDDEFIFSYGMSELESGKMILGGYNYINLPADSSGKELRVKFLFSENDAWTNINTPFIDDAADVHLDILGEYMPQVLCGTFLILFSLGLTLLGILMIGRNADGMPLVYTGIFAFIIGGWTITNVPILGILSGNRMLTMLVEYFSVYVGMIPVFLFLKHMRRDAKNKFLNVTLEILLCANILLIVVTIVLHLLNIVHFVAMLIPFHILDLIGIIYYIGSGLYYRLSGRRRSESRMLLGAGLLALCVGCDIVVFNLGKYYLSWFSGMVGLSSWGGIIFTGFMIYEICVELIRQVEDKTERDILLKIAFTDQLTLLNNRARFNEDILEIEQGGKEYTLISFDLNFLKKSNDSMGHETGDQLLIVFAETISQSFGTKSNAYRMGGDEFAVIVPGCDREEIERMLKIYETTIELKNNCGYQFVVSAAYGVSYSDEAHPYDRHTVMKIADDRMYAMKKNMKAERE